MPRDRENKGKRQVALASPRILIPAVVAMVLVAFLLVPNLSAGRTTVSRPSETRAYDAFAQAVREMDVQGVQMYRDTLYVTPLEGAPYLVQDVSPEYTIGLLTKYRVPLQGIPQPPTSGPMLGAGVLVALLLPYLLLGWLTVMLVRAAAGAADVDPEALGDESRCPECARPVPRDSRFCQHCAHPVQWTGQVRQCSACGKQVWRNDRHCRFLRSGSSRDHSRGQEGPPGGPGDRRASSGIRGCGGRRPSHASSRGGSGTLLAARAVRATCRAAGFFPAR